MKNLKLFLIILTGVTIMSGTNFVSAQEIKGNGDVTKETRSVASFDIIENDGVVNITLIQADIESVIVEADRNLLPVIITKVKDNTLFISTKEGAEIEKSTKLNVYVSFRDLKKLELNSVGNLSSQNQLKLNNLEIENNSVGNIDLNLDCNKLNIESNSVGNTVLTGKVNDFKIELNSVGNLKAFDLVAQTLNIESNAVGNAEVNSQKEISISQNGMGNITYKGDAIVKKLDRSGLGNVRKE
ncbi:MAG: DUF2807 domain-containing protein [Ignavibacteria bacterium]|nr:DUF2807 domain-containing protein [Ignavibacteria bacterium]